MPGAAMAGPAPLGAAAAIRPAGSSCFWTATAPIAAISSTRIAGPVLAGTHDFVLASRTRGEREPGSMLWHQVLAGRLAGFGIGALYGVHYSDMCAFRAIDRAALERLDLREMTYGWNIEMQMRRRGPGFASSECRCRTGGGLAGNSKVAGSLRGTIKAASRIVSTFCRVSVSAR